VYAYTWAEGVWSKSKSGLGRAPEVVMRALGLNDHKVIRMIQSGDPGWPVLRRLMKKSERVWSRITATPVKTQDYYTFVQQLIHKEAVTVGQGQFGCLTVRSCAYYARRAQNDARLGSGG